MRITEKQIQALQDFIEIINPGALESLIPNREATSIGDARVIILKFIMQNVDKAYQFASEDVKKSIEKANIQILSIDKERREIEEKTTLEREKSMIEKSSSIIPQILGNEYASATIVVGFNHAQHVAEALSKKFNNIPIVLAQPKSRKRLMVR